LTSLSFEPQERKDNKETPIHEKCSRQWLRARGRISDFGGHKAHLSALAYMSDSYFLGTVTIAHGLWEAEQHQNPAASTRDTESREDQSISSEEGEEKHLLAPRLGMMVSLDHTIWIHAPRAFRADDWLYIEINTPWSGDGRGLAFQRIFTKEGVLVATCAQEVSCISNYSCGVSCGGDGLEK
jgi:acyl-CoA thioesterase 8